MKKSTYTFYHTQTKVQKVLSSLLKREKACTQKNWGAGNTSPASKAKPKVKHSEGKEATGT